MSSDHLNQAKPYCSPQDQIQWGIWFLGRHVRGLSLSEQEECLQEIWEWGRQQGDLLCLQMIRDYRECCKESGPTYRRYQDWFLSNWNDPQFWAECERRFTTSGMENTAESVHVKLRRETEEQRACDGCADSL